MMVSAEPSVAFPVCRADSGVLLGLLAGGAIAFLVTFPARAEGAARAVAASLEASGEGGAAERGESEALPGARRGESPAPGTGPTDGRSGEAGGAGLASGGETGPESLDELREEEGSVKGEHPGEEAETPEGDRPPAPGGEGGGPVRSPGSEGPSSDPGKGESEGVVPREGELLPGEVESAGKKVPQKKDIRSRINGTEKLTAPVRHYIEDYLSGNERRRARGRAALTSAGRKILPQLRYWLARARLAVERVDSLVADILARDGSAGASHRTISRSTPVGEFFQLKLLETRELVRAGRYREAQAIAEAVLALDRDSPVAWELRRLAREAKAGIKTKEELEPRVDVARRVYAVGEDTAITFRLINRTSLVAAVSLERGILGKLTVDWTVRAINGEEKQFQRDFILRSGRVDREISLQPNEIWIQDVPLGDAPTASLPIANAVARVRVAGKFRPAGWAIGGEKKENVALDVVPAEFWVVPPGQKRGADSPYRKLAAALFFGEPESFLVGGQLSVWAAERDPFLNEKLVGMLVEHLDELDPLRRNLAHIFLRAATGEGFSRDAQWEAWWKSYVTGREVKPPPPDHLGQHR